MPARVEDLTPPRLPMPPHVAVFPPVIAQRRSPLARACLVEYKDSAWRLTCAVSMGRYHGCTLQQPIDPEDAVDPAACVDFLASHVLHRMNHVGAALAMYADDPHRPPLPSIASIDGIAVALSQTTINNIPIGSLFQVREVPTKNDAVGCEVRTIISLNMFQVAFHHTFLISHVDFAQVLRTLGYGIQGLVHSLRHGIPDYAFCANEDTQGEQRQ